MRGSSARLCARVVAAVGGWRGMVAHRIPLLSALSQPGCAQGSPGAARAEGRPGGGGRRIRRRRRRRSAAPGGRSSALSPETGPAGGERRQRQGGPGSRGGAGAGAGEKVARRVRSSSAVGRHTRSASVRAAPRPARRSPRGESEPPARDGAYRTDSRHPGAPRRRPARRGQDPLRPAQLSAVAAAGESVRGALGGRGRPAAPPGPPRGGRAAPALRQAHLPSGKGPGRAWRCLRPLPRSPAAAPSLPWAPVSVVIFVGCWGRLPPVPRRAGRGQHFRKRNWSRENKGAAQGVLAGR